MTISNNTIKWIRIGIEGAFLLAFILLCVAVGVKNKHLKAYKQQLKGQIETVDSLQARCDRLGAEECLTVNTTFVINTKNVLSVNTTQANNVSRTYSAMTKNEVLAALDSLNNLK